MLHHYISQFSYLTKWRNRGKELYRKAIRFVVNERFGENACH